MAAAIEAPDILVGHVGHHLAQLRIFAEEVLAHIGAVARLHDLIFAVDHLFHALDQRAVPVAGEQLIPIAAPDQFDDVPAGTTEVAFKAPWMILPLPRTGPSSRCRLQLITKTRLSRPSRPAMLMAPRDSGSSISPSPQNTQTLRPFGVGETAGVQVFEEARLIDAHQRTKTHRYRGQLQKSGISHGCG